MIRQILKIATFLIIGIVLLSGINFMLIKELKSQKTGDYGVWNAVINGQINSDILISGSSRTLVHFASDTISAILNNQSCYNIGLDGSPLNLQFPFLKTYLKYNKPPKIFIQELDITCFQVRKDIHNPTMYLPYLDESYIYDNLKSLDPLFWKYKYIPLYGFAAAPFHYKELVFNDLLGRQEIEFRFKGFMPVDQSWGDDFDKFRNANPLGISYEIDSAAVSDLRKIINMAQTTGAKVILVYSPEYYENYPLTINRSEIFKLFKQTADEFNVPFWDYSGIPLTRNKEYFYNSQHLNRKGAYIFSRIFGEQLKGILE